MAMIATTIISSIKVKPADERWRDMVDSPWKSPGSSTFCTARRSFSVHCVTIPPVDVVSASSEVGTQRPSLAGAGGAASFPERGRHDAPQLRRHALGLAGASQIAASREQGVVARLLAGRSPVLTTYLLRPGREPSETLARFIERVGGVERPQPGIDPAT
jgi:hypothetical protein